MRLLLSSDIHCDAAAARKLVGQSREVDAFVCAGDLAVMRNGLPEIVEVLSDISIPAVLVAGNGESFEELRDACSEWPTARVLHGSGCSVDDVDFWGVGGAIPVTPFGDWSYDLTENEAEDLLAGCPPEAVLVTHSPPFGHVDEAAGRHLGSRAVLQAVRATRPRLVVCGHIHAHWTRDSLEGSTRIVNAGPGGVRVEV